MGQQVVVLVAVFALNAPQILNAQVNSGPTRHVQHQRLSAPTEMVLFLTIITVNAC